MPPEQEDRGFYWQIPRDELLTPSALNLFQIASKHDGKDFDLSKIDIDSTYQASKGRGAFRRHGGNFQTYVRVFEEAGWMHIEEQNDGKRIIRVTPAGHQALEIIKSLPGFLTAAPFFVIESLSRFQLNNPSVKSPKNKQLRVATLHSDIFPYWTIWKIMRSLDNRITTDELRRFVFRLSKSEEIEATINRIKEFRNDQKRGMSEEKLQAKYPAPLSGAVKDTKYIMGRAGMHVGGSQPLILKEGQSTYALNPAYLPFLDNVLKKPPVFREYLDADSWFRDYGQPVLIDEKALPFSLSVDDPDARLKYQDLPDDDPIWVQVQELLRIDVRNILFFGPPGTSKTTYALKIGAKIANHQPNRFRNIQFHQSLGYEDFVQGFVPSDTAGGAQFVIKPKIFLQACKAALESDLNTLHVLVIDELNRGDASRILGDALTYIERRNEPFVLPYSGERWVVPSNLVIIATMNPYDKSIADLDDAMNRRFNGKIEMKPNRDILRKMLTQDNGLDNATAGKVVAFFDFLTSELDDRVGHAYFKDVKDPDSLQKVWRYYLLPFLDKELKNDAEKLNKIADRFAQDFGAATP